MRRSGHKVILRVCVRPFDKATRQFQSSGLCYV